MIVTTAAVVDMLQLLTMIVDNLLPGMADELVIKDVAAQEDQLRRRLAALSLPMSKDVGDGAPGAFVRSTSDTSPAASTAAPELSGVALSESPSGWDLELTLPDGPTILPIGSRVWAAGDWPVAGQHTATASVPFASAGGWRADGIFEATLVMIQTPHAIRLLLDPATGEFDASWQLPPLHGLSPADHVLG